MRVLVVTNLYPRPGHETFAAFSRQQLRALAAGHELRVVAPVPWTEELKDRRAGRSVPRHYRNGDGIEVSHPRFYFPPRVLRHRYGEFYLASIRPTVDRLLSEFRPEAVLGCWAHPDGWAAVRVAQRAGLPSVVKVVGSDVLVAALDARRRRRIAEGLSQADGVVVVSHDLAARVVGLGVAAEKVLVVPEGIDGSLFRPGDRCEARARLGLPAGGRVALFVGNLLWSKGVAVLVEACRLLADRGVSLRCYLVGRGRDEARLRTLIERRRLGDRVTLTGPRPHAELPDWYRACDFVALPSFSEGIPNVLREAMACGRPFVATGVGGIPEIAEPDVCRLVAPGSVEELAGAMEGLLASLPDTEAVAARAGHISWEESARRLAERLRSVARPPLDPHATPLDGPLGRSSGVEAGSPPPERAHLHPAALAPSVTGYPRRP
jgi:glycosyltransferase involved in cell wall biosynthesis